VTSQLLRVAALATSLSFVAAAGAQQFVYPAKGQPAEQQKKDEYECHTWAVQQTGFDPSKPASPTPAPASAAPAKGSALKGAARGAVVGEVVGDNAGAGAAAGAVAGRAQSRQQSAAQAQQQQQAAAQQTQQKQSAYGRARAACLEGRGYTIK
jgi:hypothetical protein